MLSSFYGIENEDLYKYLDEFLDVCEIVRINNMDNDALRLRLFSSLKEKAKHRLKLSNMIRITSWDEFQSEF